MWGHSAKKSAYLESLLCDTFYVVFLFPFFICFSKEVVIAFIQKTRERLFNILFIPSEPQASASSYDTLESSFIKSNSNLLLLL